MGKESGEERAPLKDERTDDESIRNLEKEYQELLNDKSIRYVNALVERGREKEMSGDLEGALLEYTRALHATSAVRTKTMRTLRAEIASMVADLNLRIEGEATVQPLEDEIPLDGQASGRKSYLGSKWLYVFGFLVFVLIVAETWIALRARSARLTGNDVAVSTDTPEISEKPLASPAVVLPSSSPAVTASLSPTETPPPTSTELPSPTATETPVPTPTEFSSPTSTAVPLPTPTEVVVSDNGYQMMYDDIVPVHGIGESVVVSVNDTLPEYIDITEFTSRLHGDTLQGTLYLRGIPSTLTFNRKGVRQDVLEYSWCVSVDIDGNPLTGCSFGGDGGKTGAEYDICAVHFVPPHVPPPKVQPLQEGVQTNVWKCSKEQGDMWDSIGPADLKVDRRSHSVTLTAHIPGITKSSRVSAWTYEDNSYRWNNPPGTPPAQEEGIRESGVLPDMTNAPEWKKIQDPVNDASRPYIDVISIDTKLQGRVLLATIKLRGIPALLTFNKTGETPNIMEYAWCVGVDVDDDRKTGCSEGYGASYAGIDYGLCATHIIPPGASSVKRSLQSGVDADVWKCGKNDSTETIGPAKIQVDLRRNTLTLVGRIPKITKDSRLSFLAYEDSPDGLVLDEMK